jgi:hypothetical protein
MALYTPSSLPTVQSGYYEQALLQGALKKRLSTFQYLQKMSVPLFSKVIVVMKRENIGVMSFFVQNKIWTQFILSKKESRSGNNFSYHVDIERIII